MFETDPDLERNRIICEVRKNAHSVSCWKRWSFFKNCFWVVFIQGNILVLSVHNVLSYILNKINTSCTILVSFPCMCVCVCVCVCVRNSKLLTAWEKILKITRQLWFFPLVIKIILHCFSLCDHFYRPALLCKVRVTCIICYTTVETDLVVVKLQFLSDL